MSNGNKIEVFKFENNRMMNIYCGEGVNNRNIVDQVKLLWATDEVRSNEEGIQKTKDIFW